MVKNIKFILWMVATVVVENATTLKCYQCLSQNEQMCDNPSGSGIAPTDCLEPFVLPEINQDNQDNQDAQNNERRKKTAAPFFGVRVEEKCIKVIVHFSAKAEIDTSDSQTFRSNIMEIKGLNKSRSNSTFIKEVEKIEKGSDLIGRGCSYLTLEGFDPCDAIKLVEDTGVAEVKMCALCDSDGCNKSNRHQFACLTGVFMFFIIPLLLT